MGKKREREGKPERATSADARDDRLAQALRSNLLKRKEKVRSRKSASLPPKRGGQG